MAGSNRLLWVLDSRYLFRVGGYLFYCFGIASRMMRAASSGVFAVASTSFASVSKYDASSVWVISSCSIRLRLLPGLFGFGLSTSSMSIIYTKISDIAIGDIHKN